MGRKGIWLWILSAKTKDKQTFPLTFAKKGQTEKKGQTHCDNEDRQSQSIWIVVIGFVIGR